MKKAALVFLIFIYAFSTAGLAVKAAYCCNNLRSVKLVLATDAKDKDGCCGVKYQTLKIKDTHEAAEAFATPPLYFSFIHALHLYLQLNDLVSGITNLSSTVHDPPLYKTTPVYISTSVFRI